MTTKDADLFIRIDATADPATRALQKLDTQMSTSQRRTEQYVTAFNNRMIAATRAVQGFAAAAGVVGLTRFTNDTLRSARSLQEQAQKLGISTTALQQYRFAAGEVGVSQNTADMALQRFTRRLGEAQQGTGELRSVLEQYNIAVRDAEGRTRSVESVLLDLADATAGAESSQEALRISVKAFDSEGAAFVGVLRRGSEGITEFARTANRLGLVLDEGTVNQVANTAREIDTLNSAVRTNLQQGLMSGLAADAARVAAVTTDSDFQQSWRTIGEVLGGSMRFVADETERAVTQFQALMDLDIVKLLSGGALGMARDTFDRLVLGEDPDDPRRPIDSDIERLQNEITLRRRAGLDTGVAPTDVSRFEMAALERQLAQRRGELAAFDRPSGPLVVDITEGTLESGSAAVIETAEALKEQEAAAKRMEAALAAVNNQTRQLGIETAIALGEMTESEAVLAEMERGLREAGVSGEVFETVLSDATAAIMANEAATGPAAMALADYAETMRQAQEQTALLRGEITEIDIAAGDMQRALEEAGVGAEEAAEKAGELKRQLDLNDTLRSNAAELKTYEREVARTIEQISTPAVEWPTEASDPKNVRAYEELLT